jgi:hypothetical protein
MKAHIYADGPITCGMHITEELHKYHSGIFSQYSYDLTINH